MWKIILVLVVVISLGTLGFVVVKTNKSLNDAGIKTGVELSPFSAKKAEVTEEKYVPESEYPLGKPINIMLLGIDRRSRDEYGYRTDIMILLSINQDKNQVVMTSLPRDLWWNGGRLNAVFVAEGWEGFQDAVEKVSSFRPERYILTDFQDFTWLADAFGGIPVNVETSFTDVEYPVDETKGYQTVAFTAGSELLTGKRALIFARSRHGNNGEGSDWMRMRRQQKMLVGMLDAVLSPKSIFNPMVVENAFKTVTTGKMDTNLKLSDAKYLWDFYADKSNYKISSLYLDSEYLHSPPMEDYGGAWVLVPTTGSYSEFHRVLINTLNGVEPTPEPTLEDTGITE